MTYGEEWTIYWNEYSSDTYLYGSVVKYHSKYRVEFENSLMPAGTVIKKWYSKTNFQKQKIEPTLPMIDGEEKYEITINLDVIGEGQCIGELIFFDRYDLPAGHVVLRDRVTSFRCPLKTYSYSLQLINAGCTHFDFHSVVIREIVNEE